MTPANDNTNDETEELEITSETKTPPIKMGEPDVSKAIDKEDADKPEPDLEKLVMPYVALDSYGLPPGRSGAR